ncbi:MAG: tRNA (adenosine(37)-N6)-threonylcarbamoyltransferase complex ATPase subunit type 1 TsaE [Fibrobacter sp.]|nr:tRNA (adenosine(37)-N6)-threonylcarbamoyltransferase complex ATPase subunit type 1 TsaE [Fibrobacter sp.]
MVTITHSVEETRELGARFASEVKPGDVYALEGDLGAGKTEFVRGFSEALGADAPVKSPSFSIINIYSTSKFPVYHFDFYRLNDPSELSEIGFYEYLSSDGVCLIEWGTMFPDVLPENTRVIRFEDEGGDKRRIEYPQ